MNCWAVFFLGAKSSLSEILVTSEAAHQLYFEDLSATQLILRSWVTCCKQVKFTQYFKGGILIFSKVFWWVASQHATRLSVYLLCHASEVITSLGRCVIGKHWKLPLFQVTCMPQCGRWTVINLIPFSSSKASQKLFGLVASLFLSYCL